MSSHIELEDFDNFDENIHGRKSTHGKKRRKKSFNQTEYQASSRSATIEKIQRDLQKFPGLNEGQETEIKIAASKQTYLSWLEQSILDQYPLVNAEKDFISIPISPKKGIYTLCHLVSGIRTSYVRTDDLLIGGLHAAESKLISMLEEHVHSWQRLEQLDKNQFNSAEILDQIIPPLTK